MDWWNSIERVTAVWQILRIAAASLAVLTAIIGIAALRVNFRVDALRAEQRATEAAAVAKALADAKSEVEEVKERSVKVTVDLAAEQARGAAAQEQLRALHERTSDRTLTPDQRQVVVGRLRASTDRCALSIQMALSNDEVMRYGALLRSVFNEAGWPVGEPVTAVMSPVPTGVQIIQRDRGAPLPCLAAVLGAFEAAGVRLEPKFSTDGAVPPAAVWVLVGTKR